MDGRVANDKATSCSRLTSKKSKTPYPAATNQTRNRKTLTRRAAGTPKRTSNSKVPPLATARQSGRGRRKPGQGAKIGQPGPCHFMKLPAEIRVDIYERVMQNAFNIITDDINSEKYMWLVWYRDRIVGRTIETAFSFLHANRTMRFEALPFCQKLANETAEYVKAEMHVLRPHWDSSFDSTRDIADEAIDEMCSDKAYTKCLKLELYRFGVEEIQKGLRIVERNMYRKGEEMKSARVARTRAVAFARRHR